MKIMVCKKCGVLFHIGLVERDEYGEYVCPACKRWSPMLPLGKEDLKEAEHE